MVLRNRELHARNDDDGEPVPDTDSASFFHITYHCLVGRVTRFITSSHTVIGRFTKLGEMIHDDKGMNPLHFQSNQADTLIRISSECASSFSLDVGFSTSCVSVHFLHSRKTPTF